VLLVLALISALNVPVTGHRAGWLSAELAAVAIVAVALCVGFVAWELRAPAPMLPLRLFRHPAFRAASLVALAYGVGLFGSTYLLPVYVQEIAHYTAASAGNLMFLPGLALALSIAIGGRLTDRFEPRFVMIGGLLAFAIGSALFAWTGDGTSFWVFVAWILVGRIGLGLLIPALNVGAVQALTGAELAYASSAVNFLRQLGGAAGVNLLAVFLEKRLNVLDAAQAPRAFHECFILVAIAFLVAIVPAWSARRTGS
jgi:MFS family permease